MANEIVSTITLDFKEYQQQLKDAEKKGAKSGRRAGNNLGGGIERGAAKGLKFLSTKILALGAALGAAFTTRAAIQGAIAQEQAVTGIATALANTGQLSREAVNDFENLASSLQSVTGVADDVILQNAALAQGFTQNAELTKELTQTALDFSKGAQISFEEATRRLGRSLSGSVDDVSKFDDRVKGLTKSQLASGEAIRILGERFRGTAAAQAQTFGGAIQKLSANFGDFIQSLGEVVTKSPLVVSLINKLSAFFGKLAKQVGDFAKTGGFKTLLLGLIQIGQAITKFVIPPFELLFNIGKVVFNTLKLGALTLARTLVMSFRGLLEIGALVSDKFKGARDSVKKFGDQLTETMFETSDDLRDSSKLDSLFNFDATQATENFLAESASFVEQTRPVVKDAVDNLNNTVRQSVDETARFIPQAFGEAFTFTMEGPNGVKQFTQQFKNELKNKASAAVMAFRNGVVGSFSSIGQALAKGENGFAAFGKAILGLFGDLAIQLGQFYFLLGLGNLFLNPSAAAQQIAAGIGLQILGGFLKGLAGGGGGTASAGQGAGGAAAAGGSLDSSVDELATQETEQERGPDTRVSINVQGNILDRRETGLELAEIINETFNTNDAVIAQAGG